MVVRVQPFAFIFLMYVPSAATVCERSPPASWKRTEAPSFFDGVAHSTICEAPGRFQSSLPVSTKTLVQPSAPGFS
ncbi:hypothetical protein [Streptomyces sp. 8P21H-1]|uniref:hypothetical protein n=1 Tax=Streptomyces sp. 8P21H-1 TaxID=2737048 RepID=UPI001C2D8BC5|nr:hypothetical protein [Streptomyces sp. 8P21H-1]